MNTEIARKLATLTIGLAPLCEAFLEYPPIAALDIDDRERIGALLDALSDLSFDNIYDNYLAHPIRVAAAYATDLAEPDYDHVALALCHNFRELDLPGAESIERHFIPDTLRPCLDILCTDRRREHDQGYLEDFYNGIAGHSSALMLLKGHDKLDNFLCYVLYDLDDYHWAVVTDHVLPRLAGVQPPLADYLKSLLPYVRKDDIKRRFLDMQETTRASDDLTIS